MRSAEIEPKILAPTLPLPMGSEADSHSWSAFFDELPAISGFFPSFHAMGFPPYHTAFPFRLQGESNQIRKGRDVYTLFVWLWTEPQHNTIKVKTATLHFMKNRFSHTLYNANATTSSHIFYVVSHKILTKVGRSPCNSRTISAHIMIVLFIRHYVKD